MENLQDLQEKLLAGIRSAAGLKELDELRVAALGKKGSITEKMKTLGTLPPEEKIAAGKALNLLKSAVENAVESRKSELETIELNRRLAGESIDVTLPVRPETQGRIHPVSKIYEEVVAIFGEMGFEVAEGPDIEDQFHNFNALNMPADHPARQMQDTFYIPNPDSADFDDSYVVRRYRSAPWKTKSRRFALLPPAALTAAITTPPIRRCFIRWRGWSLTRPRPWRI